MSDEITRRTFIGTTTIVVVNSWHQAHEVPNLFVVDGSSFTTSAAVNPTSTIGALALRAADGIWERRQEWR